MANIKHRMSGTPEYFAWANMVQRCTNPNHEMYSHYGGRGIYVCQSWRDSFENFFADMGPRPSSLYSIERRDVNGHYEPGNCYWATFDVQMSNRQNSVFYDYNGRRWTESQLAREFGITRHALRARIASVGTDWEAVMDSDRWRGVLYTHDGFTGNIREWSERTGIPHATINYRIKKGASIAEAVKK